MGVQNLWNLLLPVGRRVNVESLERKVRGSASMDGKVNDEMMMMMMKHHNKMLVW